MGKYARPGTRLRFGRQLTGEILNRIVIARRWRSACLLRCQRLVYGSADSLMLRCRHAPESVVTAN